MTEWSYDGSPLQAGSRRFDFELTGQRGRYSITGLRVMVVVARYYIDQPQNRSKRYVEYTCRDVYTSELYQGCRQLSAMGGFTDGDDNTLRSATSFLPGATGTTGKFNQEQSPAKDTDGDQVLIGFIDGSSRRPVILGVFRHSASQYGANSTQGERRLTQHKGTTIEIQSDGKYIITGVTDVIVDGVTVKLGVNATQPAIRGDDLNTSVLIPISDAATTLLVTMGTIPAMLVPPTPPNIAAAVAAVALAVGTFSTSLSAALRTYPSTLSTKVEVE